jgi:hypothetical protein
VLGSPRPRAGREETTITTPHRCTVLLSLLPLVATLVGGARAAEPRTYGSGFLVRPDGWLLTSAQVARTRARSPSRPGPPQRQRRDGPWCAPRRRKCASRRRTFLPRYPCPSAWRWSSGRTVLPSPISTPRAKPRRAGRGDGDRARGTGQ